MAIADTSAATAVEQPAEAQPAPVTDLDLALAVEDDAVRLTASADGRSSGTEPLVIVGDAGQVVATCVDSEVCEVEVDPTESASYIARAGDVFSDPVVVPVESELIESEPQMAAQVAESTEVQEGEVLHTTSDVVDGWGLQIQTVRVEGWPSGPTYASTAWQGFEAKATAPAGFDTSSVRMFVRDVVSGDVVCVDTGYPFECENGFFHTYPGEQHDVAVQIVPADDYGTVLAQLVYDGWYDRYAYVEVASHGQNFPAGDRLEITASSPALAETDGFVALYIENVTTGEFIARCTESPCSVDATYYTGEHSFRVFLADPDDPTVHVAAVTEPLTMSRMAWQTGLYQYGPVQGGRVPVIAPPNQDVGKTNGAYAVYIIDATSGAVLRTCLSGMECVTTVAAVPGRYYTSVIASRLDPLVDIQAIGVPITFTSDGVMRNGLRWETSGGWNPSVPGCQICAGDPVNTFTGEFWDSFVDLSLGDLTLERSYASTLGSIDSGWGHGWSSNLDMRLEVSAESLGGSLAQAQQLIVVQENGSFVSFGRVEGGFATAPRVQATLAENPDGTFAFTRKDGATYLFASDGKLDQITDRNGNVRTLTYGDGGELTQVADDKGRAINLSWADGHVTSVTDSAGRSVTYEYDARGDLVETTDVTGASTTYEYDSDHQVVAFTDALGARVENVYDGGRVVEQTDALGGVMTFEYSIDAQGDGSTLVTGPDGARTESVYEQGAVVSHTTAEGTTVEATTTYAYVDGLRVATTDPMGAHSTMTYDERGNVTSTTDALGRTTTTTYNDMDQPLVATDPLGGTTEVTYDDRGNTLSVIDATGAATTYVVNTDGTRATTTDPLGRSSSFTYDQWGNLASTTDPAGAVTTFRHDAVGRIVQVEDARGFAERYEYDPAGRTTKTTDALGYSTTVEYDPVGNPVRSVGPDGAVTEHEYDLAGRLSRTIEPGGARTDYTYDAAGRIVSSTNDLGATASLVYDAAGRQIAAIDPLGRRTELTYDAAGRVVTERSPSGATSTLSYDLVGQLTSTTDPLGGVSTTTYDAGGRPVTVTDADGRKVSSTFDALGNTTAITRGDGSSQAWTYDAAGQQTTYTDPTGGVTQYAFDARGRVVSRTDPTGRVTTNAYDATGNLTSTSASDGGVVTQTFDALSRISAVEYSDDTPGVSFSYDAAGRRTLMTDGTGTTSYTYDPAGRVAGVAGSTGNVAYAWDSVGRLSALTYPDGHVVNRAYDAAGQLKKITTDNGESFDLTWNDDGQTHSLTYPNGIVTTTEHDATGDVSQVATSTAAGHDLLEIAYTYSDSGLQTSAITARDSTTSSSSTYQWDSRARLISVTGDNAGEIGFAAGDQISRLPDGTELAYDTAGQLSTASRPSGTTTFTYSERGNRTSSVDGDQTRSLSWNTANQLTGVADTDSMSWQYQYNGDGLRASASQTKSDGTGTTEEFVWDQSGTVPKLLTDGANSFIYATSSVPIAQRGQNGTEYLHADALGSIRTVTDAAGQVVGEADYSPYGSLIAPASGDHADGSTRFGFAGEYADPSGLYYLRSRFYDPTTAQFISVDPLVDVTLSPFGYTDGNPLQRTDPLGLAWWDAFIDDSDESVVLNGLESFAAGAADAVLDMTINSAPVGFVAGLAGWNGLHIADPNACNSMYGSSYTIGNWTVVVAALVATARVPGGGSRSAPASAGASQAAHVFGTFGVAELRAAAQVADRNGLTRVGRALQKHGSRPSSPFYGLSNGTFQNRNDQGLAVLDEILGDVQQVVQGDRRTAIYDSAGRGVRFGNDGSFIGFLDW